MNEKTKRRLSEPKDISSICEKHRKDIIENCLLPGPRDRNALADASRYLARNGLLKKPNFWQWGNYSEEDIEKLSDDGMCAATLSLYKNPEGSCRFIGSPLASSLIIQEGKKDKYYEQRALQQAIKRRNMDRILEVVPWLTEISFALNERDKTDLLESWLNAEQARLQRFLPFKIPKDYKQMIEKRLIPRKNLKYDFLYFEPITGIADLADLYYIISKDTGQKFKLAAPVDSWIQ